MAGPRPSPRPRGSLVSAFALLAANEAITDAGVDTSALEPTRAAVVIGTCVGGVGDIEAEAERTGDSLPEKEPGNVIADRLARAFSFGGPRIVINTACAASACAIGMGRDLIDAGDADVVLAGGADALSREMIRAFASVNALADGPTRPYSRSHGLSLGEGAAFVVLERAGAVVHRGGRARAAILGYGLSGDAYHPAAPDPTGRGALLAMRRALVDAGIGADDVDYVNGHGTGTPPNDAMERIVMRTLFAERVGGVPLSSTKSMTGHGLGAAGAIEAATCVLALEHGELPPTAGFGDEHDPLFDFVPNKARPSHLDVAMSNSYAFGGNNASVILGRAGRHRRSAEPAPQQVLLTGIGAVGAPGIGRESWWDALVAARPCPAPQELEGEQPARVLGLNPDLGPARYCDPRKWRRMDRLGQHGLAAAHGAIVDANLSLDAADSESLAVIVASEHGPLEACEQYRDAGRTSAGLPPPLLFPNIAMNSTSGHIAVGLGLRGPTMTFTGSATCGVHTLGYAAELVRSGRTPRALVVAGDLLQRTNLLARWDELATVAAVPFDSGSDGIALSSASIALLLESREVVERRGGSARAVIGRFSSVGQIDGTTAIDPALVVEAMRLAVTATGRSCDDIDVCIASASGAAWTDEAEELALAKTLPDAYVTAPKGAWGDTQAGAGLASVLAAAGAFEHGCIPPTTGLRSPRHAAVVKHARTVLDRRPTVGIINVMGSAGTLASLVVEAPE